MVGYRDYKKIRNSKTTLTEKEIGYCINDVKVVDTISRQAAIDARQITAQLKNMMDDTIPTWFAIHDSADDHEDGFGSNDPHEAAQMAIEGNAYSIALVYDNGTDEQYNELVIE